MKFPRLNFRKRIEQERCDALERFVNTIIEQNEEKKKQEEIRRKKYEDLAKEVELQKKAERKNSPFRHDKFKVIYDADNMLSKVYVNGHEMKGVTEFSYNWEAEKGQVPMIKLCGYGSVEAETLSEE